MVKVGKIKQKYFLTWKTLLLTDILFIHIDVAPEEVDRDDVNNFRIRHIWRDETDLSFQEFILPGLQVLWI